VSIAAPALQQMGESSKIQTESSTGPWVLESLEAGKLGSREVRRK